MDTSVILFMDNDHSDYKREVNGNQYCTMTGNLNLPYSQIAHKLHNNEDNIWLQDSLCFSESNHDVQITDQLPEEIHHMKPRFYQETPNTYQTNNAMGKFHRAHISLIRSSDGSFKTIVKRKRKRTVFTTEQIEALEEYFYQKPYVTRDERKNLVNKLKLNDKAVKIWFQNRRLKGKRHQKLITTTDSFVLNCETLHPCLDFVESQINERTNELGYVTLDNTLTENLINVIDTVLANRNHTDLSSDDSTTESEYSPIYEPISPAECSAEKEASLNREPFTPKESFQRILDFQSILST